ncbi:hypothetical protein TanjilG_27035 [Lupinus angustifolius]|uniref:Nicotianamine synthase n=1 Tax=Lupinus angustifolius TaxID=3871 RepID=A0A4P1QVT2_LUPAN|nr:hypothetical protein TanjilG_27035 [Lupinus angustifolius]
MDSHNELIVAKVCETYDKISKLENLNPSNDITHVTSELKEYEVVFLAELVGMNTKEKQKVMNHLAKYMADGAILVLRSAKGARAFLYPVLNPSNIKGFEVLSVFHPTDEVINSVIITRKHLNKVLLQSPILCGKCSQVEDFNPLNHWNIIDEHA